MISRGYCSYCRGKTLNTEEAAATMEEIMTGEATSTQIGAFLTALRMRPDGETVEEITGLAQVMPKKRCPYI